ncbi:CAZyme family GH128 [Penicillium subrubescens]|uniref:CAZyme family GH128 n=1 Tax=Penicillium subrubescens TaxID=1316194 RepID=UPI002545A9BE|nr:CAZyme family GH128 [Penicillium subrubescens]KAJ5875019.1 CAZyme family GH128 [Penicillium subrubescens]
MSDCFNRTFLRVGLCLLLITRIVEATTKRGAAYNDPATVTPLSDTGTVTWAYNWDMKEASSLPAHVEFVPMLGRADFDGWDTSVEQAHLRGSSYILGFNEPDMTSQANLSPSVAAGYYKNYITPYQGTFKLLSPAVTSSTSAGMGLQWLDLFMKECTSCGISGLVVHWYGDSADDFKSFVKNAISFADAHNFSEVWITEFALNADVGGVTDQTSSVRFIEDVTFWLDNQPSVARYSYFMCAEGYLLSGGSLNSAGKAYVAPSRSIAPTISSNPCAVTG